jgi:hypothetical protein
MGDGMGLGSPSGDGLGHAVRDDRLGMLMTSPAGQGREHHIDCLRPRIGPGQGPGRAALTESRLRAARAAGPDTDREPEPAGRQAVGDRDCTGRAPRANDVATLIPTRFTTRAVAAGFGRCERVG